jgi:hypothetical protein
MRLIAKKSIISGAIILLFSCKKTIQDQKITDPNLTGNWEWVQTSGTDNMNYANSGIQKILMFSADGSLTVTRNDTTGIRDGLLVIPSSLLSDPVTEKTNYQVKPYVGSGLCLANGTPHIVLDNNVFNLYKVSGDSLIIESAYCGSYDTSIYLKAH